MAVANSSYEFEITSTEARDGAHPKSGLLTAVVQGTCTDKDGNVFDFIATNNLDPRYPDRFKVNWNGKNPRMPKPTGHGVADEVKAAEAAATECKDVAENYGKRRRIRPDDPPEPDDDDKDDDDDYDDR